MAGRTTVGPHLPHWGRGAEGGTMRQEGESGEGEGEGSLASHVGPGTRAALGRHAPPSGGGLKGRSCEAGVRGQRLCLRSQEKCSVLPGEVGTDETPQT